MLASSRSRARMNADNSLKITKDETTLIIPLALWQDCIVTRERAEAALAYIRDGRPGDFLVRLSDTLDLIITVESIEDSVYTFRVMWLGMASVRLGAQSG